MIGETGPESVNLPSGSQVHAALSLPSASKVTEWKVKAGALASFAATLAVGTLLEVRGPEFIETLPDVTKVFAGALLVAASSWWSGRMARTAPSALSPSTIEAVRVAIRGNR